MDATSQFVQLWTRHQAEVERYVFMMVPRAADAAEVLQEVSVQLWEKWDNYDTSRPFVPWAIRFAYLEVLKWRQRQAREKLIERVPKIRKRLQANGAFLACSSWLEMYSQYNINDDFKNLQIVRLP